MAPPGSSGRVAAHSALGRTRCRRLLYHRAAAALRKDWRARTQNHPQQLVVMLAGLDRAESLLEMIHLHGRTNQRRALVARFHGDDGKFPIFVVGNTQVEVALFDPVLDRLTYRQ